MDLAAPERQEDAASLAGLRVAKQAELEAVVRQSADLGERVCGAGMQFLTTLLHCAGKAMKCCKTIRLW